MSTIISNALIDIILGLSLLWFYFDRTLTNHKYLLFYAGWFIILGMEALIYPLGLTTMTMLAIFCLYEASLRFKNDTRKLGYYILILLGYALLQITPLGYLLWGVFLIYNYLAIERMFPIGIKIIFLITSILLIFGRIINAYTDFYMYITVLRIISSLCIMGAHIRRLQLERDDYKLKAIQALDKIDAIEDRLIRFVNRLDK